MRLFFVLALIGYGLYRLYAIVSSAPHFSLFQDFWDIWKYVLFAAIIGIIIREIVGARHRAKWPKVYLLEHAEPINHDG